MDWLKEHWSLAEVETASTGAEFSLTGFPYGYRAWECISMGCPGLEYATGYYTSEAFNDFLWDYWWRGMPEFPVEWSAFGEGPLTYRGQRIYLLNDFGSAWQNLDLGRAYELMTCLDLLRKDDVQALLGTFSFRAGVNLFGFGARANALLGSERVSWSLGPMPIGQGGCYPVGMIPAGITFVRAEGDFDCPEFLALGITPPTSVDFHIHLNAALLWSGFSTSGFVELPPGTQEQRVVEALDLLLPRSELSAFLAARLKAGEQLVANLECPPGYLEVLWDGSTPVRPSLTPYPIGNAAFRAASGLGFLRLLTTVTHELIHCAFADAGDPHAGARGNVCNGPSFLAISQRYREEGDLSLAGIGSHWATEMSAVIVAEQIVLGDVFGWSSNWDCCGGCGTRSPARSYRGDCASTEQVWFDDNVRSPVC